MIVSQINNINFQAGTVRLKNINSEKLHSFDAIKKIAEDKDLDVLILKNKDSQFLPREDMYTILASKYVAMQTKKHIMPSIRTYHGMACAIMNTKITAEETSVRIFNAVLNAIDVLEKRIVKE